MLFYQLYLMVFRLRFSCKMKLVAFRRTNSNLDGAVFKNFWPQIVAITYKQQPLFLCLTSLLVVTASVTIFFDILGLLLQLCLLITRP